MADPLDDGEAMARPQLSPPRPSRAALTAAAAVCAAVAVAMALAGPTGAQAATVVTVHATGDATLDEVPGCDDGSSLRNPVAGTLRFTRDGAIGEVTVTYDVGGDAFTGGDYFTLPGVVTFPEGATVVEVPVRPLASGEQDPNADPDTLIPAILRDDVTISVTLTPGDGYSIGEPASATVHRRITAAADPTCPAAGTPSDAASPTGGTQVLARTGPGGATLSTLAAAGAAAILLGILARRRGRRAAS